MKEKGPFKLDSEEIPLGRMKWYCYMQMHICVSNGCCCLGSCLRIRMVGKDPTIYHSMCSTVRIRELE